MSVDENALNRELASPRFLSGEDRGRWKFMKIEWPYFFVEIVSGIQTSYTLRLNCANYPSAAPTGGFWDDAHNRVLPANEWPRGSERIEKALKPTWQGGGALYIPCDRVSFPGHDHWRTDYPQQIWDSVRGITMYLAIVHDLLAGCK